MHRFCSLKALFCCVPGQPHGSTLFVQTLERFALSVTGESRGFLFSVVREGVADKPPPLLCFIGRVLGICFEPGGRIRLKPDFGVE